MTFSYKKRKKSNLDKSWRRGLSLDFKGMEPCQWPWNWVLPTCRVQGVGFKALGLSITPGFRVPVYIYTKN